MSKKQILFIFKILVRVIVFYPRPPLRPPPPLDPEEDLPPPELLNDPDDLEPPELRNELFERRVEFLFTLGLVERLWVL